MITNEMAHTLAQYEFNNSHLYHTLKRYVNDKAKYEYCYTASKTVKRWYIRVIITRDTIDKIYTETNCSNEQFWPTLEALLIAHMHDYNFHASLASNSIQYAHTNEHPLPPYGKKATRFGVITGAGLDAELVSEYL